MDEKRPSLRDMIFPEPKGESITPMVEDILAHNYQPSSDPLPEFEGVRPKEIRSREKYEAYAIGAALLPDILALIEHQEVPTEGPIAVYANKFPVDGTEFDIPRTKISEESFQDVLPYQYVTNMAYLGREYPTQFFEAAFKKWGPLMRSLPDDAYEKRFYNRLAELGKVRGKSKELPEGYSPERFIFRGSATAGEFSWDILRSIPMAFHHKYGRVITPDEFRSLARSAEPLVYVLSDMLQRSISKFKAYATVGHLYGEGPKPTGVEFPAGLFQIVEGMDGPTFRIDPEMLAKHDEYNRSYNMEDLEERFGCLAREVKVGERPDGTPLTIIPAVYQRYQKLAERFLVPHLGEYTKNVLEVASSQKES